MPEVKAHVLLGRRIRGGHHSSSRLGHRHIPEPWHTCRAAASPQRAISTQLQSGSAWPWFSTAPAEGFSAFLLPPAPRSDPLVVKYRILASRRSLAFHGSRLCRWRSSGSGCSSPVFLHAFEGQSTATSWCPGRMGRCSAPRLIPAPVRTAPVSLGVLSSAFVTVTTLGCLGSCSRYFLLSLRTDTLEAVASPCGAFRNVSELETFVPPRGPCRSPCHPSLSR